MATIKCERCGEERQQVAFQPFQNELGRRVYEGICAVCWGEWLRHQQALINHYGLNLRDPKAREFLLGETGKYLFGEDSGA